MPFQLSGDPSYQPFERRCRVCKIPKPIAEFRVVKRKHGTVHSRRCIACDKAYDKQYNKDNASKIEEKNRNRDKTRINARLRERRKTDEVFRTAVDANSGKWHKLKRDDPDYKAKKKEAELKRTYGITLEDYEVILEYQDGGCAICGSKRADGEKHLHVDHDHKTGEVRGILCARCNRGLGIMMDDPKILRRAADYLEGPLFDPPYGVIYEDDGDVALL